MTDPFTIYDKHPHMDAYRVYGFFEPYAINAVNKRFTDAELAAEYWAAAIDAQLMAPKRLVDISATVRKFASLPHFDE